MTRRSDSLSRRHFLGLSGSSLLALLAGVNASWPAGGVVSPRQLEAYRTRVLLHTFDPAQTTTTEAVRSAVLGTTDLSWLQPGDSVFVKVACNSNLPAPSVTSPAVLEGVVQLLQEAGAGTVYVGDMSGAMFVRHLPDETIGSTRENMRETGLLEAAETAGATVHCFEEVPYAEAYIRGVADPNTYWGADLQVAAILDEVDHVVNLPRLGKHVLAGASLGLKNAVGYISDTSRMVLHRDAATFHQKIAEVNAIPQLADKQRLTLTLVDQALTTYGPDSGYHLALDQPLIVASQDVVSHDQVALLTLLWARDQTPAAVLAEDPYPDQSHSLNWWFVRVTWGEEAANRLEQLPTFGGMPGMAALEALSHINVAYDLLYGGRPEAVDVAVGGLGLPDDLAAVLTADPSLGLMLA